MCVSYPADPAAATRYEHNKDVLCRGGESQAWAWTDGIQSQLLSALTHTPPPGAPCRPRRPPLGKTGAVSECLVSQRLGADEQNTRSELGTSNQACNFKLNNLLRCFLLVRH